MTIPDRATRTRLADALQGATPEMLRGDAEFGHGLAAHPSLNDGGRDALRRLAALALAVAEMQEHPDGYVEHAPSGRWFIITRSGSYATLPSALAALLRISETP